MTGPEPPAYALLHFSPGAARAGRRGWRQAGTGAGRRHLAPRPGPGPRHAGLQHRHRLGDRGRRQGGPRVAPARPRPLRRRSPGPRHGPGAGPPAPGRPPRSPPAPPPARLTPTHPGRLKATGSRLKVPRPHQGRLKASGSRLQIHRPPKPGGTLS